MRIEYHRTLIADAVRNAAFRDAMAKLITPGKTAVADIGAGTALLGLIAAKLGAKEVFLYEAAEVAGVAHEVLKVNRAKQCHLMPCHSTEMDDPPKVDLVVSETLGNYALEENIIATLDDARRRHLKPGGTIIPNRITQYIVPVISDRIYRELTVWNETGLAIDLSPCRTMSLNNVYVRTFNTDELLDGGRAAKAWDVVDLSRDKRGSRKGEATFKIASPTTIYGFAYWWSADLAEGIALSTSPSAPKTHWEQLFFPLATPIEVGPQQSVVVSLRSQSSEEAGTHLAWSATKVDQSGKSVARQSMDLDKGWIP